VQELYAMAYKIVLLYLCVCVCVCACTHTHTHYLSQNNCILCTDFLSTWYEHIATRGDLTCIHFNLSSIIPTWMLIFMYIVKEWLLKFVFGGKEPLDLHCVSSNQLIRYPSAVYLIH